MASRPRLDKDVEELAERSAKFNGRSFPNEINFALRAHYLRQADVLPKETVFGGNPFFVETIKRRRMRRKR